MKINFLLITIITAGFSSCSTSYKTGQTPDDVYYSPARLETHEVRRDREERPDDNTVYTNSEDRDTRRRIRNRRYRRYDDRYDYPYGYNNGNYGKYPNGNYQNGTTQNTSQPRKTNLGAYTPNKTDSTASTNIKPGKLNTGTNGPVRTFGTPASPNNGSGIGNAIRRIFTGDNNSGNNNTNRSSSSNSNSSSRSFEPRSSNNNNSNSSNTKSSPDTKSTSAPVRTFKNN